MIAGQRSGVAVAGQTCGPAAGQWVWAGVPGQILRPAGAGRA